MMRHWIRRINRYNNNHHHHHNKKKSLIITNKCYFGGIGPDTTDRFGGGYYQSGHRAEKRKPRILVTGAMGQIGTELVPFLREKYGVENVIASDIKMSAQLMREYEDGPFVYLDVTSPDHVASIVVEQRISWVVHLASMLSAVGERNPELAMRLNSRGIENVLNVARQNQLRVFAPSTIAVFGESTPKVNTPDVTIMQPSTIYGVTKVYLELLGQYYHQKFGVDFRSLRYPGIISSAAAPGGGTTDYAVEIYHSALKGEKYKCFLEENTVMPMLYMPDCLRGTENMISIDQKYLTQRVYNITGISFSPAEQVKSIQKFLPNFKAEFQPDFRQAIASSWPQSIDDSAARKDWGWNHEYDLDRMSEDMLNHLKAEYEDNNNNKS